MAVVRSIVFYIVFYLGSLAYTSASLAVLPFDRAAFRRVVRGWARFQRRCVTGILGMTIREEGERPPPGPVLYAIKHESFFEAIDLPALLDEPAVFAKEELFRIPLWGASARAFGIVPVARDQGARALRAMIAAAKMHSEAGRPLAIFPEGTRVPHGTRPQLQSGFAGLYKMLGLPVIPVAVDSGPLYHRPWKRKGTITYRFGEPIPPGLPRDEAEARVHAAMNALNSPASAGGSNSVV
ncbi:2-acyl-glycerophospho-ethanolamine acyltransferase [Tsuneonella dongtanensis]|uniref:2-acyl-glycerophospho-ethanolamine acyltransferase n=1 Tax=Tsuneonella dongtanensis TaxID=692370 RepID=A0A1B2AB20_9SPHN|nr:lysophospholipid acyltransferase family protein [Tsuneonella dongtanensis]ANY19278.1 2-acyl-glycerophospho-ethanolamine acyltransferase [Tsuneonella dongtanensis]